MCCENVTRCGPEIKPSQWIEYGRKRLNLPIDEWLSWFDTSIYHQDEPFVDSTDAEWDWYCSCEHAMFVGTSETQIQNRDATLTNWIAQTYANYDAEVGDGLG